MKTFYSAQEIEDLARQGVRELMVDENVVLTDLARQTAAQVGVRLLSAGGRPSGAASAAAAPSPVAARSPAAEGSRLAPAPVGPPLAAKPRGCQHGPHVTGAISSGAATSNGPVIDDLVSLVKQMGKR